MRFESESSDSGRHSGGATGGRCSRDRPAGEGVPRAVNLALQVFHQRQTSAKRETPAQEVQTSARRTHGDRRNIRRKTGKPS